MRIFVLSWLPALCCWVSIAKACDVDYRYDYESMPPMKGWFKFHRTPETFLDAFLRCKLEGAVLASPLDYNLMKSMVSMMKSWDTHSAIYTGIHATISKGDFTSVEGIPLSKIPLMWAPDEPDNCENEEDCIVMLHNGTVADVRCNDTYPYICYKEKTEEPVLNECGTVDTGYVLEPSTGSCYKFHSLGTSWRKAQRTCLAEGGHLAIINDVQEANVLKDLFEKHPHSLIRSSYPDTISLGYLDWDKKQSWYTVNGQSLEEAGYARWNSGSPNNRRDYDGGQHCGGMYRNGNLDDIWCDSVRFAYICEMNPKSLCETNLILYNVSKV